MSKLLSLILSVLLTLTTTSTSAQPSDIPSVSISYVVNINTDRFHSPDCRYVDNIKSTNRWDFDGSRDELIVLDYVPCKYCNP